MQINAFDGFFLMRLVICTAADRKPRPQHPHTQKKYGNVRIHTSKHLGRPFGTGGEERHRLFKYKQRILQMREAGDTFETIAKHFHVTRTCVWRYYKKYIEDA